MDILENELIRKYFGCQKHDIEAHSELCEKLVPALDVLRAMQEPIRSKEKFIWIEDGEVNKTVQISDMGYAGNFWHPDKLRLPEKWQAAGRHWHTCNQKCGQWEVIETTASEKCTCHYTDERVEDPKCPRHKPADSGKCECLQTGGVHWCGKSDDSETAVEALLQQTIATYLFGNPSRERMEKNLRELVRLARR